MSFAQMVTAAAAASANPGWWERAVAGVCSHGGHGWDGEVCSDAPEPASTDEEDYA